MPPTQTTDDVVKELQSIPGWDRLSTADKQDLIVRVLDQASQQGEVEPSYQPPTRVGDPRTPLQAGLEPETLQSAMSAPTVPDIRYGPPLEPGLEEGFTDPRTMALTIGGGLAGSAGMRAGMALAPYFTNPIARAAAPYLGSAAGSEAVNLAAKATEPGATVGSVLTPDLSDVVATGVPLAAGTRDIGRAAAGALARSSRAGKVAQESVKKQTTDAARASAQAFNDQVQADFDLSTAKQAHTRAMDQAKLDDDLRSYNVLLESYNAEKARQAEVIRGLTQAQREGNVVKAADYVAKLPNIPTRQMIDDGFAELKEVAGEYAEKIVLPTVAAQKKALLEEAKRKANVPGAQQLVRILNRIGKSGKTSGLSLDDIKEMRSTFGEMARNYSLSSGDYAAKQAKIYSDFLSALENDLDDLALRADIPATFRGLLKINNAQYLKYKTHQELTRFATFDMVAPGPGGIDQFTPQRALKALDSDKYESLRRYMQKTTFDELGGKNLYDLTKQTLRDMAGSDVAEKGALIAQRRALQRPVEPEMPTTSPSGVPRGLGLVQQEVPPDYQPGDTRPGLLAVGANIATRLGFLGLGASALGQGNYTGTAGAVALAAAVPSMVAQLLGTSHGQRLLLRLMQEQGPSLSPTMMGFINAAARSQFPARESAP